MCFLRQSMCCTVLFCPPVLGWICKSVLTGYLQISLGVHVSDCSMICPRFLSNIWAVSVMSPAMRKAVPRNHRRAPSQKQPHPAPDLPPILGLSPSARVSQARGPNAVQSPDHGYLHFPSNISYCSQLFPVWGCPGMRCLCVGRQSHRPMEAVI